MERRKKIFRDSIVFLKQETCVMYWRRVRVIEEHREHHCSGKKGA